MFYAVQASFFSPDGEERLSFAKRMTLQINAAIVFTAPSVMSISESMNSCLVHPVHKSVSILPAPKYLNITPVCLIR